MGFGGDIKEENTKLKEKIEKEMQPEIDRLIKENTSKKNNEEELQKRNKELQNQINNYKKIRNIILIYHQNTFRNLWKKIQK